MHTDQKSVLCNFDVPSPGTSIQRKENGGAFTGPLKATKTQKGTWGMEFHDEDPHTLGNQPDRA